MATGKHGHKLRGLRGVDDELWDAFGRAVDVQGLDRSSVLRMFVRWYLGRGELPERPPELPEPPDTWDA